ncbi:MAG: glycosyltransferase family 39 protein [Pseudomonadota bacterium]
MERLTQLLCPLWQVLSRPGFRLLTVLVVSAIVVLPGIATLPVTDRDEARFAQATKQMLETGDLIDIRFQDQPRWKKPVGIYWLQAISTSFFGGTEADIWAYRLPSALAAILSAIAMLWTARAFVGPTPALIASLILATSVLFAVEANIAKTDAALMLTGVLALGALGRLLLPDGKGGIGAAAILWLSISAAILLKGPIIPLIAILAGLGLWAITWQRPPYIRIRPAWGIAVTLTLCAPWLFAIWMVSDGAFFQESLGKDLIGKVQEGKEKHWGPPGLYSMIIWGTFWPWAAFLPLALPWMWRQRKAAWMALLIAWVVPFWIILEAVPTKLPHYVLPLYPAIAIALGAWLIDAPENEPARWQRRLSAGLVGAPGFVLGLACLLGPVVIEGQIVVGAALLALPALAATWIAVIGALAGNRFNQAAGSIIAALCLFPAILQFGLPSLQTGFGTPRIAAEVAQWRSCSAGPLITIGYREPSLIFRTETGTIVTGPNDGAQLLRNEKDRLFLVEDRWWGIMAPALPNGRPELIERASVSYFNYNRGKPETARLFTPPGERWADCE